MKDLKDYLRYYNEYAPVVDWKPDGFNHPWTYYHKPEDTTIDHDKNTTVYYGNIKEYDNTAAAMDYPKYIEVPFCTWSDYSGCTVERSNQRSFMNLFGNIPGVYPVYGGYGTAGVLIEYELYESNQDIQDVINGLFDYPLINEEDHSELEFELEDEAWDWIKYDLPKALLEAGKITEDESDDEDALKDKFYQTIRDNNIYFIFEDAVSAYIRIEEVVKAW